MSTLHIVQGGIENGDKAWLEKAARLKRDAPVWTVPKSARIGDEVVIYVLDHGFFARARVGSLPKPRPNRPNRYGVRLTSIRLIRPAIPIGIIREKIPELNWAKYPRSITTPPPRIAERIRNMITYRRTRSMKHKHHTRATRNDFLRAFSNESLLTDSERTQLRLHYHQPDHAATFTHLGKLMDENCHQGASRRNVCMAQKITRFLGIDPPRREDGSPQWWTFLVYAEKTDRYWRIQLRPEVVSALSQVDWMHDLSLPESDLRAELEEHVAKAYADPPERRRERLETTPKKPSVVQVTRTEFRRNADVMVEVMLRAGGVCEGCDCRAPFVRITDGTPYLEVHHILPLANGGEDTVGNAAALCPNCHRRAHHAGDARAFSALLKRKVAGIEKGRLS